jgi:hypothetical protein
VFLFCSLIEQAIITLTKHTQDIVKGRQADAKVELVAVTPAMVSAGLERARELAGQDLSYIVSAIYLAMEYERLWELGQLNGLGEKAFKVR